MSNAVPEGWSYSNLSDLAFVDKESLKGATDPDYEFRYVDIASVSTGRIELPTEPIRFKDSPSRARKKVQQGDVLMSTVRPNLQAFAYFDVNGTDYIASTGFAVIRAKDGNDGKFLFNTILADDVTGQIDALVVGSNYPAINSSDVKNLEVLTPTKPEQQKIATILSSVDDVIEKTQAQIDKLKDLKTGMMQELLTKGIGHNEFKDSPVGRIPVGWDVLNIKDVVDVMESGWSPQCDPDKAGSGDWAILKTTSVTWEGFDYQANKRLPDNLEPRPAIQVNAGNILITRAGPAERVGVVAYINHVPERVMLSDKLIRLVVGDNYNSRFVSYWLSSDFVRNFFSLRTTGLAQSQTNISQEILKSVPCVIPSLDEQEKISSTINTVECRLNAVVVRKKRFQSIKKALMQDLLTGTVRVKVD